ncbi:MAG TPA: hypothetical protein VF097_00700 [Actinomycetota bacterium]
MGDGDLSGVSVDAVFERFPASVRGAVVVRGVDPDPHQVRLTEAVVVEVGPSRAVRNLELGQVTVDVAPRDRVMIPFEVPFSDLEPGWYTVQAEVDVDGQESERGPREAERRFCVAWPSEAVRRGSVEAGIRIKVPGSRGAAIDRLVFRADSAAVHWRHAAAEKPGFREFGDLKVTAGRRRLHVLDDEYEWSTGSRTTTIYPVMRGDEELTLELDRRHRQGKPIQRGPWSATLSLP